MGSSISVSKTPMSSYSGRVRGVTWQERRPRGPHGSGRRTGVNRMQADLIVEHLQAQSGKDVVLRVAGQEYAIRGIYEAGAAVIIEAGGGRTAGAGVAPQDALREAEPPGVPF